MYLQDYPQQSFGSKKQQHQILLRENSKCVKIIIWNFIVCEQSRFVILKIGVQTFYASIINKMLRKMEPNPSSCTHERRVSFLNIESSIGKAAPKPHLFVPVKILMPELVVNLEMAWL